MGLFSSWKDRRIAELEAQLAAALARIVELEAKIALLEAKLGLNSQNCSQPPSTDPPGMKRMAKQPSGRAPGGQPGHKPHKRDLLPPYEVDDIIEVHPPSCHRCGRRLDPRGGEPSWRHQVIEVPRIEPTVTEYRLYDGRCQQCDTCTPAELPPGVPTRGFGPRLTGMVTLLSGRFRLSKRLIPELLLEFLGVDLATGSVSNLEQEMSGALAEPVEEARAFVRTQPMVNADETGWYEGRKNGRSARAWLWVAVTSLVTVFQIAKSRGGDVAKDLLGHAFAGFLGTDRWNAYNWVATAKRQLCWSHLRRDAQGFVDRGGAGAEIGRLLLEQITRTFRWWHRIRDGTLSRPDFQRRMRPVRAKIIALLREASVHAEPKTKGMAVEILKLKGALFSFVDHEGIEPTNNVAERQVRPGVIWRKISFGTQCENGSRFVERILTVTATLRQQNRNVLDYLVAAYSAKLSQQPAPSLLPS